MKEYWMRAAPRPRRALPFACLLVASALAAGSRADDTDMTRANQLLREGQALKRQGKLEQGCQKIEESVREGPGYAAELELADCHAALGRPARAVQELSNIATRAAARSKADTANLSIYQAYIAHAERRIKALTPKLAALPRITISLSAEALATGLKVKLDGIPVEPLAGTTSVVVDAGHHLVRVTAPGKRELTWEGDLTTGERTAAFEKLEDEPQAPAATALPITAPSARTSPDGPGSGGATARDAGTVTALVLGVAGLGVGTGFTVAAGTTRDEGLRAGCGETGEPAKCVALRSTYDSLLAGEILGFVGAWLGLGLAGVLFFTRPAAKPAVAVSVSPVIGPAAAGFVASGRF
jgi:hypothetical protein